MADVKITALPAAASVLTTDIFPIVADPGGTPTTKKSTFAVLQALLNASPAFTGSATAVGLAMTGQYVNSYSGISGAATSAAIRTTGSPFFDNAATNNKPLVTIEDHSTSTNWDVQGAYLGINAKASGAAWLLDLQYNGSRVCGINYSGNVQTRIVGGLGIGAVSYFIFDQFGIRPANDMFDNTGDTFYWGGLSTSGGGIIPPNRLYVGTGVLGVGVPGGALSQYSANALIDVVSTTKGTRPFPHMTTTQKNALTPDAWTFVVDTTLGKLCMYNGATWETVTSV